MFTDRTEAGRFLAQEIARRMRSRRGSTAEQGSAREDVVVLALPRGGVPVAFEVARALEAPLDVFVVRKLGVPAQPEVALGAIASGGVLVVDERLVRALRIPSDELEAVIERERRELLRRERAFRGDAPPPDVRGKTVLLVDDGLATGASMQAALTALRAREPARLVAAVPVGAAESCAAMQALADEVVCATTPEPFHAVGLWYADFTQTSDAEVRDLLARATRAKVAPDRPRAGSAGAPER
jgi:predicted phosphoribosyltransferase